MEETDVDVPGVQACECIQMVSEGVTAWTTS